MKNEEVGVPKEYSLDDLDLSKSMDKGFEFEVVDDVSGKGRGIFLTVVGGHSTRVQDFLTKSLNERRTAEAMADKRDPRGKQVRIVPIEQDIAFADEYAAIRITGWRGIKQAYTHDGAIRLCKGNALIKDQVLTQSEKLENFTETAPTS